MAFKFTSAPSAGSSRLVEALLAQGSSQQPIITPLQGFGRLAQLLSGSILEQRQNAAADERLRGSVGDLMALRKQIPFEVAPQDLTGTGTSVDPFAAIPDNTPRPTEEVGLAQGPFAEAASRLAKTPGQGKLAQMLALTALQQTAAGESEAAKEKRKFAHEVNLENIKAGKPQSSIGKLVADYTSGRINQEQYDQGLAVMNKPGISLGNAVAQGTMEIIAESRQEARGAIDTLNTARSLREAVSKARLGPGAETFSVIDRIAVGLGIAGENTQERLVATTQAARQLAEFTLSARSALKGQGQVSNFEQATLEKARSGNISDFTEAELNAFIDVTERLARLRVTNYEKMLERAKGIPEFQGFLNFYQLDTQGALNPQPKQSPRGAQSNAPQAGGRDFSRMSRAELEAIDENVLSPADKDAWIKAVQAVLGGAQ